MPLQHLMIRSGNTEEFQSAIRNRIGCEVNLKQRSSRAFLNEISMRSGPIFTNIRTTNAVDIDISSQNVPEILSIFAPESGSLLMKPIPDCDLYNIDAKTIVIFDPSAIPRVTLLANSTTEYFTIQKATLRHRATHLTGGLKHIPSGSLQLENIETVRGRLMASMLSSLTKCYRASEHSAVSNFTIRQLEEATLFCLLDMISTDADAERHRAKGVGKNTVKAAIDLARNSLEPMTVGELAQALGVTARALQVSFKKDLGMSPHTVLKQIRLLAIRRELEASGQMGIHSIAKHWGFSNFSRFKTDYVAAFGMDAWPIPEGTRNLNITSPLLREDERP